MPNSIKYLIALVLVSAGVYWVMTSPARKPETAVANHGKLHYSATWSATKVLAVQSSGGWGNVPAQKIPIGVAEWRMVMTNTGTHNQIATETWTVPGISGTIFDPSNQVTTPDSGFDPNDWLFASHIGVLSGVPNGGKVTYTVQDLSVTPLENGYTYRKDNVRVGGNAIKCATNSDSNCLQMRGAYGWEVYHGLSNLGSERGRISASGAMMPLKWIVTGELD